MCSQFLKNLAEIAPTYIIINETLTIKELHDKYLNNKFKNQKVELIND